MPSSRKKKKKKPPRPFADPSVYADIGVLEEQLRPGLNVIMCGINPGQSRRQSMDYRASAKGVFFSRCRKRTHQHAL